MRCEEAHNGAISNSEMLDAAGMCRIAKQSSQWAGSPLCVHLLSPPLEEVVEAQRTQGHVHDASLNKTVQATKQLVKVSPLWQQNTSNDT